MEKYLAAYQFVVGIPMRIYWAWVFTWLWLWFVSEPFGVRALSVPLAYGLAMLIQMPLIRPSLADVSAEKALPENERIVLGIITPFVMNIIVPSILLFIGFVIHKFFGPF